MTRVVIQPIEGQQNHYIQPHLASHQELQEKNKRCLLKTNLLLQTIAKEPEIETWGDKPEKNNKNKKES